MTDVQQCKGCHGELKSLGSFWLCGDRSCDRFAIPVNEDGLTPEQIPAPTAQQRFEAAMLEGGTFADGSARND